MYKRTPALGGTVRRIAWRNLWRNPRRTGVLTSTIAVGLIGYLATTSFSRAFTRQMVDASIDLYNGHIQITARGYQKNPSLRLSIDNPDAIRAILDRLPDLAVSPFVSQQGMAQSSQAASAAVIHGIVPADEAHITTISRQIVQGSYLHDTASGTEIVVGEGLAEKLDLRLGEKIVLMANSLDNSIATEAFRIVGMYRTSTPEFDKAFVFLHLQNAQRLFGYDRQVSGFSIRLRGTASLNELMDRLAAALEGYPVEILSWQDRYPLLMISLRAFDFYMILFLLIVFTAIAFSIANAFLMVIYERVREIGVMMAMGARPALVRKLLFWETLFVTAIGAAAGLLISMATVAFFGARGIDLSLISDALGKVGIGSRIYPALLLRDVFVGLSFVFPIAVLAVYYPARKASRFTVVDALAHT